MRSGKPRCIRWAAWLALAALALNALVPIHVAFDVAEAVEAMRTPAGAEEAAHDHLRDVLALLSGHRETGHQSRHHDKNHQSCAVCTALATLGGFVQPVVIALLLPPAGTTPIALPAVAAEPGGVVLSYRSRAPPIA